MIATPILPRNWLYSCSHFQKLQELLPTSTPPLLTPPQAFTCATSRHHHAVEDESDASSTPPWPQPGNGLRIPRMGCRQILGLVDYPRSPQLLLIAGPQLRRLLAASGRCCFTGSGDGRKIGENELGRGIWEFRPFCNKPPGKAKCWRCGPG